ncbi:ATP-dependent nuclease subunit B [Pedobacter sp. PACM 27299]|uniref:PD-(D/E)XK nuclease family protein n=1 Tax=Pedobacter sp. PACM 27299 TaxID=1727164 RepID=UPI00070649F7|nr:PD-(D/E)XK nuclease family protein [Pedobacter sp. PACM 27299]ALL04208.1 ATP-dependent nuclease subunit B [Pedobacter sp. PACM 27299]
MKAFLKEVAEDLVKRLGSDLHHAAVVFNNKRPVPYLQNHLADTLRKPFWAPSFFTIQEFFALSTHLQVADGFNQFFTLLKEYNKLIIEEGGKSLNPDVFYPIARIILSDFSQIDNDLVNADQLFQELEDIAVIEKDFQHLTAEQQLFLEQFWSSFSAGKQQYHQEQFIRMWRRMPKLYRGFHAALREKGYTTMAYIYRQLAEGKADKPEFIDDFKNGKIVFAGFNALSNAEAVIFKQWNKDEKALFYFDVDKYYMEDETQEAGLFLRKNIQRLGLPNALGEARDLIRGQQKEINVYKTQGQTAQAKILHQELLQDYPLLDVADNAGKIALILADESLLLPVLQTIPTKYQHAGGISNIELNVTMGYPLLATSIFGLADLWLSVQAQLIDGKKDTIYYREVEAFLSHPLTGVLPIDRDAVQQEILKAQLIDVPIKTLHKDPLSILFFSKVDAGLIAIEHLQQVFKLILERQLEEKTLKQTEADLFGATLKELNRLHDTLADYAAHLPLSFVLSLMQKAVQGIAVPLSGEPLQGVQVMGLLESRSLDFEHVYVLGVTEGILPQINVSPSFIPDSIRRAYGLPVIENQDAISAYMFYRLLQRSNKVSLVYNGQADDSNTGEPSRFLKQLEFESGYTFKYFDQSQSLAIEPKVEFEIKKEGEVLRRLYTYLDNQEENPVKLSATRLTTYLNCPLQFFYKYIAKVEEPEELAENMEANSIGSILHKVMELFYQKLKGESPYITKERIAENRKQLKEMCKLAFAIEMFDTEEILLEYSGMQQVMLAIVAEYANVILDHDEQQAPFSIVELENNKDYDKVTFPIHVKGEERKLTLLGIIDRVDQRNGVTRIVDYKTGRDEVGFSSIDELFDSESGKQNKALVQTLFYTYVYEQTRKISGVEPNLYIVRKMRDEGTLFYLKENRKRVLLQAEHLEDLKGNFTQLLRQKLEELFNPDLPFKHTTVAENCTYCPYLTLCGK